MVQQGKTNSARTIRRSINHRRRSLGDAYIAEAALNIRKNLWQIPALSRAETIGCYISVNGEADPGLFVADAWLRKKRIFMPVLRKNGMAFYELSPADDLKTNAFGIPEPIYNNTKPIRARNLNVILVPLVAFDNNGNRLGMGGGYYDRLLAFTKHRPKLRRPLLIGLAYDFQRLPKLSANHWDIPLHAVVTNTTTYEF